MSDSEEFSKIDEKELELYADKTRKSLISRLDNWEDQQSWDQFYKTYWKLIFTVATKAGLRQDEAWDVVQETIFSIAKQSKTNKYDPSKGSFKSWLWQMTQWRLNDQFRKRKKDTALHQPRFNPTDPQTDWLEKVPDDTMTNFDQIWDNEWQNNLLFSALAVVKEKVAPLQYQIFDYYVLKEWSATKVARHLQVSIAQVYLSKHRVGSLLKKELAKLSKLSGDS